MKTNVTLITNSAVAQATRMTRATGKTRLAGLIGKAKVAEKDQVVLIVDQDATTLYRGKEAVTTAPASVKVFDLVKYLRIAELIIVSDSVKTATAKLEELRSSGAIVEVERVESIQMFSSHGIVEPEQEETPPWDDAFARSINGGNIANVRSRFS